MKAKGKGRIVEAVGSASVAGKPGLGKRIEEAMASAAAEAMSEGVKDQAAIRERMLAAREEVKRNG